MSLRVVLMHTASCGQAEVTAARALLSRDEQDKAAAFRFFRDQRDYVMAHALLRRELARAVDRAPASIPLTTDAKDKPVLLGAGPAFNLSHCDGLVAVALGPRALGVDVESVGTDTQAEIWDQVLHPDERRWLAGLPAAAQPYAFRQFWTLKEAVLKADGIALRQDPRALCFTLDPVQLRVEDGARITPDHWAFAQRRIGPSHVAAVAHAPGEDVTWQEETGPPTRW
ncbi:4'-phosphopantetheinyl transferase [Rubricella aquisinus]|uniref:4'-phosphopantetheinyl transferase n=1 Tax=Rubricella aquisinus TaxID=2028108 RepID=A0A840X0R3_9RHOB|nr:4'-phosphopantetheinyl transferase superfamily protein [Rubricella aquisinus]MBB5516314.1 4'-phosphopantetheinyl transferase [Rubricella aquisinus]